MIDHLRPLTWFTAFMAAGATRAALPPPGSPVEHPNRLTGRQLKSVVWRNGEADIDSLSSTGRRGFVVGGFQFGDWKLSKKVQLMGTGTSGTGYVANFK